MRIAGAASLASASTVESNGYNEVFVYREGVNTSVVVRPVRFDGGEWIVQDAIAFHPGRPSECALRELLYDS
jgi:hypothetical protein